MPELISGPSLVEASGTMPKVIREFVGRVNTRTSQVSIAFMSSPQGWEEPGQRPDFDEYTVVLHGTVVIEHKDGAFDVNAGQAVLARAGEWVRYTTPGPDGAEYLSVCVPAFSPESVHRDE